MRGIMVSLSSGNPTVYDQDGAAIGLLGRCLFGPVTPLVLGRVFFLKITWGGGILRNPAPQKSMGRGCPSHKEGGPSRGHGCDNYVAALFSPPPFLQVHRHVVTLFGYIRPPAFEIPLGT